MDLPPERVNISLYTILFSVSISDKTRIGFVSSLDLKVHTSPSNSSLCAIPNHSSVFGKISTKLRLALARSLFRGALLPEINVKA